MHAQPPVNRSSPWPRASEADPRGQGSQRLANRSIASSAKTFLVVMACGLLLGYGLAWAPVPGAGPQTKTILPARATDSTASHEAVPVSQLPVSEVEKPLDKLTQPAPVELATTHAKVRSKGHRSRATQRVSRPLSARARLGAWFRQAREKILPRRRDAPDAKHKQKKGGPCKCAFKPMKFLPATIEVV